MARNGATHDDDEPTTNYRDEDTMSTPDYRVRPDVIDVSADDTVTFHTRTNRRDGVKKASTTVTVQEVTRTTETHPRRDDTTKTVIIAHDDADDYRYKFVAYGDRKRVDVSSCKVDDYEAQARGVRNAVARSNVSHGYVTSWEHTPATDDDDDNTVMTDGGVDMPDVGDSFVDYAGTVFTADDVTDDSVVWDDGTASTFTEFQSDIDAGRIVPTGDTHTDTLRRYIDAFEDVADFDPVEWAFDRPANDDDTARIRMVADRDGGVTFDIDRARSYRDVFTPDHILAEHFGMVDAFDAAFDTMRDRLDLRGVSNGRVGAVIVDTDTGDIDDVKLYDGHDGDEAAVAAAVRKVRDRDDSHDDDDTDAGGDTDDDSHDDTADTFATTTTHGDTRPLATYDHAPDVSPSNIDKCRVCGRYAPHAFDHAADCRHFEPMPDTDTTPMTDGGHPDDDDAPIMNDDGFVAPFCRSSTDDDPFVEHEQALHGDGDGDSVSFTYATNKAGNHLTRDATVVDIQHAPGNPAAIWGVVVKTDDGVTYAIADDGKVETVDNYNLGGDGDEVRRDRGTLVDIEVTGRIGDDDTDDGDTLPDGGRFQWLGDA